MYFHAAAIPLPRALAKAACDFNFERSFSFPLVPSFPPPLNPPVSMLTAIPSRSRAGFSLVEVALAIGIVAFAFVALLGLIPTGLNTFRQAIDKKNETAIVQDLNSMVQVTPWDKI